MITSDELREGRLTLRLSQGEMATILGCSQSHLSRMENGKAPVSHIAAMTLMLLKKAPSSVNAAVAYGRAMVEGKQ